ncbi:MAG: TatD family hydrolase [Lachnospiraceae bacterium]|nr:TatD family hydrolase [Lachnospiraceae bacterium]
MIFETHAHYDDPAFDEDREEILEKCHKEGIDTIVNIGVNKETIQNTLRLAKKYPFVYAAIGVHPSDSEEYDEELRDYIKSLCLSEKKVLAIGEIGLDYHWEEPDRDTQIRAFVSQLKLAEEIDMPIAVHSRDAAKDTLDIIKEYGRKLSGVIHCYSYHVKDAKEYVEMGYYIGVGGVVTFKNANKLKEVVKAIPIESIVLETDSPYLAPSPYRGKRNCSLYIPNIIEEIARLKEMTPKEVEAITHDNGKKLYRLDRRS